MLTDFYQTTSGHTEGDSILYSQRHEKQSNWLLGMNALDEVLQKLRAKTFW